MISTIYDVVGKAGKANKKRSGFEKGIYFIKGFCMYISIFIASFFILFLSILLIPYYPLILSFYSIYE